MSGGEVSSSPGGLSIKLPECPKNLASGFPTASDPRKIRRITKMEATVYCEI